MRISDWWSDLCSSDLLEARDHGVERAAVFRHHLVAALHRPGAGAERASGHIIISAAGFDHRLLADHALALHLVEDAVAVADQPMAREKLDLPLPFVFDPHMIGPEPAPVGRLALIGKVAHDDANRHAARGRGMREQSLQRPTALQAGSDRKSRV